jgi:hypothetical protein
MPDRTPRRGAPVAGSTNRLAEADPAEIDHQQREPRSLRELDDLEARVLNDLPTHIAGRDRPARRAHICSITRPRAPAGATPRGRARASHQTRPGHRAGSSSTTSGSDPGSDDSDGSDGEPADLEAARLWPDPPRELVDVDGAVRIAEPLAGELDRIAARRRRHGGLG